MQQLSAPDRAIAVQNRAGAALSRISPQAESGILDSLYLKWPFEFAIIGFV